MSERVHGRSFADLFLVEPDLFPGRVSGETLGDGVLTIDLAGGPYALSGLDGPARDTLTARLAPRVLPRSAAAEFEVRTFRSPANDFRPLGDRPWELDFDLAHDESAIRVAGPSFAARIELEAARAGLWMPPLEGEELATTVENLLRIVVAYRVAELGGVLLHSAGIVAEGRAWVFVGRSGAGKSTLSRLSLERGHELLSDELNALWRRDGALVVERLPFAGELSQSAGSRSLHPLAGLFLLRQAAEPALSPVGRADAVARLAAAAPFLNVDARRNGRLLENLDRLTADHAVRELGFAMDPGFWDILIAP